MVELVSCAAISGLYKNEVSATTKWRSPTLPATARSYLAHLLTDGTSGSIAEEQAAISAVRIDGNILGFTVVPDTPHKDIPDPLRGKWSCAAGKITIQFESPMIAEHSAGRTSISISLFKARDGALIVRQEIHIKSLAFGVVPSGSDSVDWMMFPAVAAH